MSQTNQVSSCHFTQKLCDLGLWAGHLVFLSLFPHSYMAIDHPSQVGDGCSFLLGECHRVSEVVTSFVSWHTFLPREWTEGSRGDSSGPEHSLGGGPHWEGSLLRPHTSPVPGIWRVSTWPSQRLTPRIMKH